jgi:ribonuclease P protein component
LSVERSKSEAVRSTLNTQPSTLKATAQDGAGAAATRHTHPRSHHLRLPRQFEAAYAARVRESRGPLTVYALPNDLGHPRLGLSVSRKVGTAVRRNRIRRLLREAFRLMQHDFPRGYDLVIVVRPHEPLMLAEYQKLLAAAVFRLHQAWQRREAAAKTAAPLQ